MSQHPPSPTEPPPDRPSGGPPDRPPARSLERIGPDFSLRGRRVRLRPLAEADLPARLRMTNDPQIQLETLGTTVGERTPYDIRSWFASLARDPYSRQLAIEDESGRYIGDIDLHSFNPSQGEAWLEPLIGDPDVRARGPSELAAYLTDAVATLARWLFLELGLRRLLVEVLTTNPVALQALTKLGFKDTGRIDHMNGVYSHILELTPQRLPPENGPA